MKINDSNLETNLIESILPEIKKYDKRIRIEKMRRGKIYKMKNGKGKTTSDT